MVGLLWSILWYLLVANTPLDHPSISKEELAIMDQINYNEPKQVNCCTNFFCTNFFSQNLNVGVFKFQE